MRRDGASVFRNTRRPSAPARRVAASLRATASDSDPDLVFRKMSPEELSKRIFQLGLTHNEAAHLFGVDPRTMRRLIAGEKQIAPPVIVLLKLLEAVPGAAEWLKSNPNLLD